MAPSLYHDGVLRVQMEELSEIASVLGSEYQPIIQEEMDEAIPSSSC